MKKNDVHQELPKALVTGCAGKVGSEVTNLLLSGGFQVFGLDNLSAGTIENLTEHREFQFINGDIRDLSLFALIGGVDYVFHCAGMFDPGQVAKDPVASHHINVIGSMNVLEYCRRVGARIIYIKNTIREANLLQSELDYFEQLVLRYEKDFRVKQTGVWDNEPSMAKALVDKKDTQ